MLRVPLLFAAAFVALPAAPAGAEPAGPFVPPPFAATCTVHHFGEGVAPDPAALPDDPLCVEYDKRDITVDDGGAVAFALAEPARFAAAVPKCRYWQQDHWSIQTGDGETPLAAWDGSYWFDKGAGTGGVLARNFRVLGRPVGAEDVAAAIEPVSADLAAEIHRYGAEGGGGGAAFSLGGGDPTCAAPAPTTTTSAAPAVEAAASSAGGELPETGGHVRLLVALGGLAGAALALAARRTVGGREP